MRGSYPGQQPYRRWRDNEQWGEDDADGDQMAGDRGGVSSRIDLLGRRVETGFENMNRQISDLALKVQDIPTRAQIEASDSRRVSLDTYTSDMRGIEDRLTRQETGWARMLPWISILVSIVGSILIPLALAIIYGIVYLAQHP